MKGWFRQQTSHVENSFCTVLKSEIVAVGGLGLDGDSIQQLSFNSDHPIGIDAGRC